MGVTSCVTCLAGYVVWGFAFIYWLLVCCFFDRIQLAIAVNKVAATFVRLGGQRSTAIATHGQTARDVRRWCCRHRRWCFMQGVGRTNFRDCSWVQLLCPQGFFGFSPASSDRPVGAAVSKASPSSWRRSRSQVPHHAHHWGAHRSSSGGDPMDPLVGRFSELPRLTGAEDFFQRVRRHSWRVVAGRKRMRELEVVSVALWGTK